MKKCQENLPENPRNFNLSGEIDLIINGCCLTQAGENVTIMAKLGSEKRPVVVKVHSDEKARYVAETCAKNGWHYIIGFEPDKPEDISDLEKLLNPPQLVKSEKIGRNDPCPCGSGKKFKKCCGANNSL